MQIYAVNVVKIHLIQNDYFRGKEMVESVISGLLIYASMAKPLP